VPEKRHRTSEVGTSRLEAPPVWWATPYAGGQHPRTVTKVAGRAGKSDGAPADERKGMRQGRDRPKRVKRTATPTSREFHDARTDVDRAGSLTER